MVVAFLVSDGIFSLSGREGIYIRAETTASVEGRRFPRCSHATKGSLNHQQEKRFFRKEIAPHSTRNHPSRQKEEKKAGFDAAPACHKT